ncbi:MAG: RNA polymerase sigma factor [Actinomycetota bacterium]|nr:RNA polymerase sigma factor [Actinomycetota bacterium]
MTQTGTLPPFQELLDEHSRDVLGFLVASVGHDDADDCFQETFIAALRAYPKLEHADNLRSWLLTIAHRKAIDHQRAGSRRARPAGSPDEVGGRVAVPDRGLEAVGNADGKLLKAISVLPPKQRSAVLLRYAGDMAYARIGEMLDCSPDAARRNVHEGLKKLRGELR